MESLQESIQRSINEGFIKRLIAKKINKWLEDNSKEIITSVPTNEKPAVKKTLKAIEDPKSKQYDAFINGILGKIDKECDFTIKELDRYADELEAKLDKLIMQRFEEIDNMKDY